MVPDEAITTAADLDDEGADGRKAIAAPRVYDDPGHSPAEIRAAQDRTSPIAIDDVLTTEERPQHPDEVDTISASSDRPEFDRPEVDEDEDTVLIATETSRSGHADARRLSGCASGSHRVARGAVLQVPATVVVPRRDRSTPTTVIPVRCSWRGRQW